jgi:hypothetical protein
MVFWFGIAVGLAFVYLAVKIGFYDTWAMLFNIVVSLYLGIRLRPVFAGLTGSSGDVSYNDALAILITAVVAFVVLEGITYIFFTGPYTVSFPRIFDSIFAGALGFFAGLLVWSFIVLLVSITPLSKHKTVKTLGFGSEVQQTNLTPLYWWGGLMDKVVLSNDKEDGTKKIVHNLLDDFKERSKPAPAPEPEPEIVEVKLDLFDELGPPPEMILNGV